VVVARITIATVVLTEVPVMRTRIVFSADASSVTAAASVPVDAIVVIPYTPSPVFALAENAG